MGAARLCMTWEAAKCSPGSTLVAFSTFDGFLESLDKQPNLWETAVRRGAEQRRSLRRPSAVAATAPESDVISAEARAAVAVLVRDAPPDGKAPAGNDLICQLLTKLTGMTVVVLPAAPCAGAEALVGPIGLLVLSAGVALGAFAALEAQCGHPDIYEAGCTVVLTDLPPEGFLSLHVDCPPCLAYACEKDKKKKDVLSLRRWETLQDAAEKQLGADVARDIQGFGVPSAGALIFYPDGWIEALQSQAVRLRPRTVSEDGGKKWEILDDDENFRSLPHGFASGISPLAVVADWLVEGRGLAFTGAGISKESGVPTFRDGDGLWERYDAMEVSSIGGFAGEPAKVWDFEREFNEILDACAGPNDGHRALALLESLGCVDLVVTQNVDGFQQAAGSKHVVELHGSEVHAICLNQPCGHRVEMREIFRNSAADSPLWSPLARGWGVRWPALDGDSALQQAVRGQLAQLQRPKKRRRTTNAKSKTAGEASAALGAAAAQPPGEVVPPPAADVAKVDVAPRDCAAPVLSTVGTAAESERAKGNGAAADHRSPRGADSSSSICDDLKSSSSSSSSKSASNSDCDSTVSGVGDLQVDERKKRKKARRQAKLKSLSKACAARDLVGEELERGPPECRVPICPKCRGGVLKPDGIFFGESLDPKVLERSVRQSAKSKVVLIIGTSGTVDPAARLPLIAKKKSGARIVEVNIKDTRLSPIADIRLRGPSASVLPKVQRLVSQHPRMLALQDAQKQKAVGIGPVLVEDSVPEQIEQIEPAPIEPQDSHPNGRRYSHV